LAPALCIPARRVQQPRAGEACVCRRMLCLGEPGGGGWVGTTWWVGTHQVVLAGLILDDESLRGGSRNPHEQQEAREGAQPPQPAAWVQAGTRHQVSDDAA
jgi:hypothetical protein